MSSPASPHDASHGLVDSHPMRYGDLQDPPPPPKPSVDAMEKESVKELHELIDEHAPHLILSFIRSSEWWWERRHLREAHMFKHLLFKGFVDIILIFNSLDAEDPSVVKEHLKQANEEAAPIWNDETIPFETRVQRCRELVEPVIAMNRVAKRGGEVTGIPTEAVVMLNKIYRKYYVEPDNVLLIGRTTEEAYKVQDSYGRSVAYYLQSLENGKHLESRAITCLRKAYGRNSVPLLTASSVQGLWEICQSPLYRRVTSLLYKWIQPFAQAPKIRPLGCNYVDSLHRFLKPKEGKHGSLFREFYSRVLMWSTDLYLVALLDEYVAPQPVVADYVRKQLLQEDEKNVIQQAIDNAREGQHDLNGTYGRWLWYSGIDFDSQASNLPNVIARGDLLCALFDLMLGQSVKIHMLNHYTEFHEVRCTIESFLIKFASMMSTEPTPGKLWWDGTFVSQSPDERWITTSLKNHADFFPILESWVEDSTYLQNWLQDYEAETPSVNNPKGLDRVFSEPMAIKVLQWLKLMGSVLDQRRKTSFSDNPTWFIDECEGLGLFTARTPRFLQLFFYEFLHWEIFSQQGPELSSSSSLRAAKAYLLSGIRLESMCGISDAWYRYVESHQTLYTDGKTLVLPLQQQIYHPRPRPDHPHEKYLWSIFKWEKKHSRPQPRKKKPLNHESTPIAPCSSQSRSVLTNEESDDSSSVIDGTPTPQQIEGISEYTEVQGGGFCESSSDEEAGEKLDVISEYTKIEGGSLLESLSDEETGEIPEVGGEKVQDVRSPATQVKVESPEYLFEDELPATTSFSEAFDKAVMPLIAANGLEPPLVSEEPSPSYRRANGPSRSVPHFCTENPAREDQTEDAESSRPSRVLVYASDAEGSGAEGVVETDAEYAADAYTMAAHRPSKAEKQKAFDELIDRRRSKKART